MLLSGLNWRHFPSDSATLCVFYAPGFHPLPKLPHYKSTADLPAGRLLINPGTTEFYQDCADEVRDIVASIGSGYERTVHFGFSQGATGALDIGLSDPRCSAIFGISPHFVLERRYSRSARCMSAEMLSRPRESLIDRLNETDKSVQLFISCLDVEDGVQVRDAEAISAPTVQLHFILQDHFLASVNNPNRMISEYLATGAFNIPADTPIATDQQRREAALSHDLFVATQENVRLPESDIELLSACSSPTASQWLGRYFTNLGMHSVAAECFIRAALLGRETTHPVYDSLLCAGNAFAALGLFETALGCYRESREIMPLVETVYFCEADLLARKGRKSDLLELLGACVTWGFDSPVLDKIRALLP